MEAVIFWLFSAIAIASALLCVTRRNPVASALWLVLTMFSLAGIFVLLEAHFIAAMQVLVYAGAIMVLFLFVIMLLNVGSTDTGDLPGWMGHVLMLGIGGVLAIQLWAMTRIAPAEDIVLPAGTMQQMNEQQGAVKVISEPLFREFLVPFEITSVLLLAAVVGAVVLAKRRL
jgi:NADH-quinone oxidoreductase subunit J